MSAVRCADHRHADSWAARLRARRFAFFESLIATLPAGRVRILDVGGTPEFWLRAIGDRAVPWSIVVVNVAQTLTSHGRVVAMRGDARRLPFMDGAFDVAFSNSVIEHVGSLEDQRRFADEVQRVGRRYFVQTPNRYFPIEPHFHLPFGQFWPKRLVAGLLRRMALGTVSRRTDPRESRAAVDEIRLMTPREMRALFPGATLYRERVAGLVKSVVAYNGWPRHVA